MQTRDSKRTVEVCLGVTGLKGAFSHGVVSEARHVLGPLLLTVLMLPLQSSETVTCIYFSLCFHMLAGSRKMCGLSYQLKDPGPPVMAVIPETTNSNKWPLR